MLTSRHLPARCRRRACAFEQSRLSPQHVAQAYEFLVPFVRRRLPGPARPPSSGRVGDGTPTHPYHLGGIPS
jgi:hypothetical protein